MKSDEWLTKLEIKREEYSIKELYKTESKYFYFKDTATNKQRIVIKCVREYKVEKKFKDEHWKVYLNTGYFTIPIGVIGLHKYMSDNLKKEVVELVEDNIEKIVTIMENKIKYCREDLNDIKNIFSEKLGINQVSLMEIDNVD